MSELSIAPKNIYGLIFLPIIIFIGLATSYEDFLISRIRNKWILLGLLFSFAVLFLFHLIYLFYLKFDPQGHTTKIFSYLCWNSKRWLINLAVSSLVAYFIWYFRMWGAGDGKLFIAYAALIPIRQYSWVYFNYYFASFLLLLAIFVPPTIFLLTESIIDFLKKINFQTDGNKLQKIITERVAQFDITKTLVTILSFFILYLSLKFLQDGTQQTLRRFIPDQNATMLILLATHRIIFRFIKIKIRFIIIISIFLFFYFMYGSRYELIKFTSETLGAFGRSLITIILIPLFSKIIDMYSEKFANETAPFAHWMFLGVLVVWFWR